MREPSSSPLVSFWRLALAAGVFALAAAWLGLGLGGRADGDGGKQGGTQTPIQPQPG